MVLVGLSHTVSLPPCWSASRFTVSCAALVLPGAGLGLSVLVQVELHVKS